MESSFEEPNVSLEPTVSLTDQNIMETVHSTDQVMVREFEDQNEAEYVCCPAVSDVHKTLPWKREDVLQAYQVEKEYSTKYQFLIIYFPDPELNIEIVKQFHENIDNVFFPVPSKARCCLVRLKNGTDIEKTVEDIQGSGNNFKVEKKISLEEENVTAENIDPYTLFITNISQKTNIQWVKEKFPTATRIDIGFRGCGGYALIGFNTVNDSVTAYRDFFNLMLESRIIVKFRRYRGSVCLPRQPKPCKTQEEEIEKDMMEFSKRLNNLENQVPAFYQPQELALQQGVTTPKMNVTKRKQGKRCRMSQSYPSRPWNEEDAIRVYHEEMEHSKMLQQPSLIIRFPDLELNTEIVKQCHESINNVYFRTPSRPRYCFVQLKNSANVEKTIQDLQCVQFNGSSLTVEKRSRVEEKVTPEELDPYTLYIGNLPPNVNSQCVKEKFPTATKIDIGFAQRIKFTRYAFIRYNNVEDSIQAYRDSHNLVLESRSIIVRFRRHNGQIGLPGEPTPKKFKNDPHEVKQKNKCKKIKGKKNLLYDLRQKLNALEKRLKILEGNISEDDRSE